LYDDIARRNLEEPGRLADGTPGIVHIGLGLQRQHLGAGQHAFRDLGLEFAPPRPEAMPASDGIDGHETDIVAVGGIFQARIA
jgi:hypothetical protein